MPTGQPLPFHFLSPRPITSRHQLSLQLDHEVGLLWDVLVLAVSDEDAHLTLLLYAIHLANGPPAITVLRREAELLCLVS